MTPPEAAPLPADLLLRLGRDVMRVRMLRDLVGHQVEAAAMQSPFVDRVKARLADPRVPEHLHREAQSALVRCRQLMASASDAHTAALRDPVAALVETVSHLRTMTELAGGLSDTAEWMRLGVAPQYRELEAALLPVVASFVVVDEERLRAAAEGDPRTRQRDERLAVYARAAKTLLENLHDAGALRSSKRSRTPN